MAQRHLHPPIVDDNRLCPFINDDPAQGYQSQRTGDNCFRFPVAEWSLWTYPQYYADSETRDLPGAGLADRYASIIDWLQPCRGATCTQWPGGGNAAGSFAFQFTGTGARIYSNSAPFTPLNTLQNYTVSLDGGPAQAMTTDDYLLFSIEDLTDGDHIIEFDGAAQYFTVDYAVVIPGERYHRTGQQVHANYTDEAVTYHGDWEEVRGGRKSSSVGDTVSLTFSGSVAFVLGMKENLISGDIDIGFSLDGSSPIIRTFSPNMSTDDAPAQFFGAAYRDTGLHNLTVSTVRLSGALSFLFSGFTYGPDFMSVDEMPDLSTTPDPTTPEPDTDSQPDSDDSSRGAVIGGAVGGAVGGLLLIAALLFFFLRRRRRNRAESSRNGAAQELPVPYRKDYMEPSPLSPVHRAPSPTVSAAPTPSIMSSNLSNYPVTPSALSHADTPAGRTTTNAAEGGDPRIDHIIDLINTHYETINQPPAYTASQGGGGGGSEAGGRL